MLKKLWILLCCCLALPSHEVVGQSMNSRSKKGFFDINRFTLSAYGGYSGTTVANSGTFLNTLRYAEEKIAFKGHKMGLQVSLTTDDYDVSVNKISLGVRGDMFKLEAGSNPMYAEDISLFYIGLVQGGSYAITPSGKVDLKLELTLGYSQFKDVLTSNMQKRTLSATGVGYGISLFVAFELARSLYLNIGGDLLESLVNHNIQLDTRDVPIGSSQRVLLTTAVISITRVF